MSTLKCTNSMKYIFKEVFMEFKDYRWEWIKDFLQGKIGEICRFALDNCLFIEAVMWVARNGGRWRYLPPNYAVKPSVFQRFQRWWKCGIWQVIFNTLAANSDNKWLMIDSTIVRAHQLYATSKKSKKASVYAILAVVLEQKFSNFFFGVVLRKEIVFMA